jgi:hypothetical protein
MEIVIRRSAIVGVLAVSILGGLGVAGYRASPRDEAGRPVLLLPDVRQVESYRREAAAWVEGWATLDVVLEQVLEDEAGSLLTRSRQVQRAVEQAVALAREVDARETPPALLGLHELAVQTASRYLEASAAVARWLSAPTSESRAIAVTTVAAAQDSLTTLENNGWIRATGGVGP